VGFYCALLWQSSGIRIWEPCLSEDVRHLPLAIRKIMAGSLSRACESTSVRRFYPDNAALPGWQRHLQVNPLEAVSGDAFTEHAIVDAIEPESYGLDVAEILRAAVRAERERLRDFQRALRLQQNTATVCSRKLTAREYTTTRSSGRLHLNASNDISGKKC
jgi:hypothetical protein